jgi:hypothetical protein
LSLRFHWVERPGREQEWTGDRADTFNAFVQSIANGGDVARQYAGSRDRSVFTEYHVRERADEARHRSRQSMLPNPAEDVVHTNERKQ